MTWPSFRNISAIVMLLLLANAARAQEPAGEAPVFSDANAPAPAAPPDAEAPDQPAPAQPAPAQPAPPVTVIEQPAGYDYAQPAPQPQVAPQPTYYQGPAARSRRLVRYHEGMTVPPNATIVERNRNGMIISGGAMFGASYVFTALMNSALEGPGELYIPVIGPFIYMADDGLSREGRGLVAFDGILQTVGLTMFILGFVLKKQYIQLYAEADDGRWRATLAPTLGAVNGLGFDLAF